ncbi:MAG: response regulator transcription factor [Dehalococcoidia bacterium]|nr:response regulator transcription factor [Dehalococcoidia bacterium]
MPNRADETYRTPMAFVTHTRDYRSADLLPALARNGYTTTERPHDRETGRLLNQFQPQLVVLAVDPRNETDVQLVSSVANSCNAQILVLAPGPHPQGMALALDAGANVCIRDTDGVDLLVAQVGALARARRATSSQQEEEGESSITVRDLTLDFDRCQAVRGKESIPLTPTEFKILAFLAKSAGKVVSPVEILRAVQDYTYSDREAQEIVKVYIRRIRRKIEVDPSDPNYIVNVRGFGYMLERRGLSRDEEQRQAA